MDPSITKEIVERMHELPAAQQQLVLEIVRSLASQRPQGVPARDLLAFAGVIGAEDAREMVDAIEEGLRKSGRECLVASSLTPTLRWPSWLARIRFVPLSTRGA